MKSVVMPNIPMNAPFPQRPALTGGYKVTTPTASPVFQGDTSSEDPLVDLMKGAGKLSANSLFSTLSKAYLGFDINGNGTAIASLFHKFFTQDYYQGVAKAYGRFLQTPNTHWLNEWKKVETPTAAYLEYVTNVFDTVYLKQAEDFKATLKKLGQSPVVKADPKAQKQLDALETRLMSAVYLPLLCKPENPKDKRYVHDSVNTVMCDLRKRILAGKFDMELVSAFMDRQQKAGNSYFRSFITSFSSVCLDALHTAVNKHTPDSVQTKRAVAALQQWLDILRERGLTDLKKMWGPGYFHVSLRNFSEDYEFDDSAHLWPNVLVKENVPLTVAGIEKYFRDLEDEAFQKMLEDDNQARNSDQSSGDYTDTNSLFWGT